MIDRPWIMREQEQPLSGGGSSNIPPVISLLLSQRGYGTPAAQEEFLHPAYEQLADPFLYRQMRRAVDRIRTAIAKGEQITVYGDYDVDGITAAVILVEALQSVGAKVDWYIPERQSEGYGLNIAAIEKFHRQGTTVLLAVDCGTTNVAEVEAANALGLDVMIFDHHHQPAVLPPAYAIINPVLEGETYPEHGHSSGGVAFTAARALALTTSDDQLSNGLAPGWEKWLLDVAAISTIADMVPLRGENRILAMYGLLVLRKTRRPGLRALFDLIGTKLQEANEYAIGFQIAPRLNAAGRLQHASIALELLLTRNRRTAAALAADLDRINRDRQKLTELATSEALEQISAQGDQSAYVAFAAHWSPGILGLVAGRLTERFGRPVIVMTEQGDDVVGSGRSIHGVDIMEVFDRGQNHFRRYGGHPGACGFTLVAKERRQDFAVWFQAETIAILPPKKQPQPLVIDTILTLPEVTPGLLDALELAAPFGTGNDRPKFLIEQVTIERIQPAGSDGQHVRLDIVQHGTRSRAIGFRFGERIADLQPGQVIDVVVELSWNRWNGRQDPQLTMIDWRAV